MKDKTRSIIIESYRGMEQCSRVGVSLNSSWQTIAKDNECVNCNVDSKYIVMGGMWYIHKGELQE